LGTGGGEVLEEVDWVEIIKKLPLEFAWLFYVSFFHFNEHCSSFGENQERFSLA